MVWSASCGSQGYSWHDIDVGIFLFLNGLSDLQEHKHSRRLFGPSLHISVPSFSSKRPRDWISFPWMAAEQHSPKNAWDQWAKGQHLNPGVWSRNHSWLLWKYLNKFFIFVRGYRVPPVLGENPWTCAENVQLCLNSIVTSLGRITWDRAGIRNFKTSVDRFCHSQLVLSAD